MENKIFKILADFRLKRITIDEATDNLLDLHSVSQQRELLKAFQKHYNEELNWTGDHIIDKDINDFLSL